MKRTRLIDHHFSRGMHAIAAGKRDEAEQHLDALFEAGKLTTDLAPGLLGAELLIFDSRKDAARALLKATQKVNPQSPKIPMRLCELAREAGDHVATLDHSAAAAALDPEGKIIRLKMHRADIFLALNRRDDAIATLEEIMASDPSNIWAFRRLAGMFEKQGNLEDAIETLKGALPAAKKRPDVAEKIAKLYDQLGDHDAAIEGLQAFLKTHGPNTQLSLFLANICLRYGRRDLQLDTLTEAIRHDPVDPALLKYVFSHAVSPAEPKLVKSGLQILRQALSAPLFDELKMKMLQNTLQFDLIYKALRGKKARTAVEARQMASALLGAYRIALGLRYMRFCLRRWPQDQNLLYLFVNNALKHGDYRAVDIALSYVGDHLPEDVLTKYKLMRAAYRGDFDTAVEIYAAIREAGTIEKSQRNRMVELLFAMLHPKDAGRVFALTGDPVAEDPEPRSRFRHFGQLMTEMKLEFEGYERDFGGTLSIEDWARARPGSTVTAIRLINEWRAEQESTDHSPCAETVPRTIHQYWDEAKPPASLEPLIETWRNQPGFSHQLYDRGAAQSFVTETYGKDWGRAFRLAIHPSQEADFFRLCMLAKTGGIYADVDDVLLGDLKTLLGDGDTLLMFRQPLGGAIGNNFIAAPPGHPALTLAAQMACDALLSRCNETVWSATGPGLLTRAIAQYLLAVRDAGEPAQLRLLDWPEIGRHIAMFNPVDYKATARHWNRKSPSTQPFWKALEETMRARRAASAQKAPLLQPSRNVPPSAK